MLKYRIGHEDRVNMRLFFGNFAGSVLCVPRLFFYFYFYFLLTVGFVGLFNIVLLWPGFIILHYTGLEQFEVPSLRVVLMLVVNAIVGTFISDYLWLMAMLMTSPVIVTLGLSLTIPLAILFDLAQVNRGGFILKKIFSHHTILGRTVGFGRVLDRCTPGHCRLCRGQPCHRLQHARLVRQLASMLLQLAAAVTNVGSRSAAGLEFNCKYLHALYLGFWVFFVLTERRDQDRTSQLESEGGGEGV